MYLELLEESIEVLKQNMGKPFYVFISLGNICNANCIFCNVHEEDLKQGRIDMPGLLEELKSLGTRYVHFIGGGEPFTEKQIWSYFQQITGYGMNIAVTTNGLALDNAKIQELSKFNVTHLFFSLDSHFAELHDGLRRVSGLWQRVTDNIRNVKKTKPQIKIVVNHLLNKENIRHFEDMLRLKESVPFDYINPLFIKDCPQLYFSREQISWYSDNIDYFYGVARDIGVKFLYNDIHLFKEVESEQCHLQPGAYRIKNFSCYFPRLSAYVDCPTAQVFPCDCTIHRGSDAYLCGDLLEQSFGAIWYGERMEDLREKLESNKTSCKRNCDPVNVFFNEKMGR